MWWSWYRLLLTFSNASPALRWTWRAGTWGTTAHSGDGEPRLHVARVSCPWLRFVEATRRRRVQHNALLLVLQYVERRGRPSDASGSAGALTAAAELSSSTHRLTTARLVASAAAICCAHSSAAAIQRHGRRIVDRQRHSSATSASKLLAPASCRAHSDSRGRQANSVAGARQPQRDCFREATGRQVVRAGGQGGDPSAR